MTNKTIVMDEALQHQNVCDQVMVSIYEKMDITKDLQEIITIILTELVARTPGDCAVVQIYTSVDRKNCFGYHEKEGFTFWEPNDRQACPGYMQDIIKTIAAKLPDDSGSSPIYFSNILYIRFLNDRYHEGYLAMCLNPADQSELDEAVSIIKAVNRQLAVILNQKLLLDDSVEGEKLTIIDRILSTFIHDLKNPISGISGFIQLIEQKSDDDSIKRYCNVIMDSLSQLSESNNELYTIVSGRPLKLEKLKISLSLVVKEIVDDLIETYNHSGIAVDLSIGNDTGAWVDADKKKIVIVIKHILKNAKEAMPDGGTIHIKVKKEGILAEVEIGDTGKGMPAHIQESYFKPFVSYGKENATGLGMAIAHRIISEHNGTISIASFLGKGTVISLHLPSA